ncbi:MAG: hypothetical protein F6J86_28820, partial [Symploca sp. SIO1B1]|nr:hypothetical protein [Symploca sp. SIO1B1]
WRISTLAENQEQLRWFDREFNDLNWSKAASLGQITETTYSRVSQGLFEQPLLGNWITGHQSERGEVWLRGTWGIEPETRRHGDAGTRGIEPETRRQGDTGTRGIGILPKISLPQRQRAFIRFAGQGNYSLLVNGSLVKYDDTGDNRLLHLYEVTNLLNSGNNTLAVRLSHPVETDGSSNTGLVGFYLDGWIETEIGEAIAPIVTDESWTTEVEPSFNLSRKPTPNPSQEGNWRQNPSLRVPASPRPRVSSQESATFLRQPHLPEFKCQFEGDAALLNYPKYLWHQLLWCLGGIFFVLVGAWSLGLLLFRRRQEIAPTFNLSRKPTPNPSQKPTPNPSQEGNRRQKPEGWGQKVEARKRKTKAARRKGKARSRKPEVKNQKVRSDRIISDFKQRLQQFDIRDRFWDSLAAGTILLLPGTLFLIAIGLLKHRYGEAELALQFAGTQSNRLILAGFVVIVSLTVLLSLLRRQDVGAKHLGDNLSVKPKSYNPNALPSGSWKTHPNPSQKPTPNPSQEGNWRQEGVLMNGTLHVPSYLRPLVSASPRLHFSASPRPRVSVSPPLRILLNRIKSLWQTTSYWWVFASILIVGFGLRIYRLGFVDLDPDANVSLDCVRGILRTGAPISTSGIWYTRSPFYHYALAAWLRLVGDSDFNAALFSVLLGTATLAVIYLLAKQISGKVWIALLITAVLAIDPWEIWYSRNIRFYQINQFLYLLGFWAFVPGFITSRKPVYQGICFISLTLMLLTQEVTITLLPVLAVGAFYFYLPFRSAHDWRLLLVASLMAFIYFYDGIFVMIKCLTEIPGLSSLTTNYLKLYLSGNVTYYFTDFFVGFNRMKVIYTVFYLAGFLYFLLRKDKVKLFLYGTVLINIVFITFIVLFEGSRYTYPLYPLFVILSIYSACHLGSILGAKLAKIYGNLLPFKLLFISSLLALLLFNIEPLRVLSSYQDSITARHIQVNEYIKNHQQPGDIVISNVPSVHSSMLGGVDYFIPHRMSFFDAAYWRNGQLVDRWEGGVVVTNADQLTEILAQNHRVWLHLLYSPQLPSDIEIAKFHDMLETLGEPVLETFGTTLRLWDSEAGVLPRLVNQGKELGSY